MESTIISCKTIPSRIAEIPQKPAKSTVSLKKGPNKLSPKITDAHLKSLCRQGRLTETIAVLDDIAECGSTVRYNTLSHLIDSCIDLHSLDLCYELHARVRKLLKEPYPFVETKIVGMFAKCGSLKDAVQVFDGMRERDLYAWSAVIGAFSREKKWAEVVESFYSMMEDGDAIPDSFLLPKILQACGNCGDVETGRLIHAMVIKRGMSCELRVNNSILAVYAKCGLLNSAKRFFDRMEVRDGVSWNAMITGHCQVGKINEALRLFKLMRENCVEADLVTWNILISSFSQLGNCNFAMKLMRDMEGCGIKPDVFTWTSMILGLAQNDRGSEALKLFREMLFAGVEPNEVTLMSVISACGSLKDFRKGKEVHLVAVKLDYGLDVLVGNSLVDMYSKCGKLDAARKVFDIMPKKDVYTWNSMIGGYCQSGYCGIAYDLFENMQELDVVPNVITWNAMITGYIRNGDEDEAMDLFHRMEKDGGVKRDTASWNALIAGYLHLGQTNKGLGIFRQMQSCAVKPNSVTILSILPACANLIALKKLKEIHGCILRRNLESEISVANSLIDTYAKSGNMKYSKTLFDWMASKDTITWNAMISGYVLHGYSKEAIELFEYMIKECTSNRGTFASLISAYGLAEMVDEGRHIFSNMTEEYQILPGLDHYVAMVNLYGRSGMLDEAFDFIKDMSIEPDGSIWFALLTACRRHGNAKLAIHAVERLLHLEPENVSFQRLFIQINDLCGIPKDSLKIKRPLIRKYPTEYIGLSWIEDANIVHTFVSGDLCQLDSKSVHSWIKGIDLEKTAKYRDMLEIQEEEKEETGGVHSEKLALAFALINSRKFQSIRIVKNLRMCEHCHRFAKLVSATHGCGIYLHDSKTLHHFQNGICSCGDYW